MLGCSLSATKSLIHRGRETLKEKLKPYLPDRRVERVNDLRRLAGFEIADALEHGAFTMRRVNHLARRQLHLVDGQHVARALVEQPDDVRVQLVNRLAMFGNVHGEGQNAEFGRKNQICFARLLGNNSVRADGKRNNHVAVNHEQRAIFVRDIEIENLVTMPESAFKFMNIQRRMMPVVGEQGKLGASHSLNFGGKQREFFFEANCAAENHKSLTMSSIDS